MKLSNATDWLVSTIVCFRIWLLKFHVQILVTVCLYLHNNKMYCLTSQSYFQYSYTGLHLGEGGGKRGHSLSPLPESNSNPHLSLKLTIPYQYVLLNVVTSFILARSKIFLHGGKPPDCLYKQSMRTGGMPLYTFVPRSHTAVPNSQHCVRPGNKTSAWYTLISGPKWPN